MPSTIPIERSTAFPFRKPTASQPHPTLIKVMIDEFPAVISAGLRSILGCQNNFEIVSDVCSYPSSDADIVITNFTNPVSHSFENIRFLHQLSPQMKILIFAEMPGGNCLADAIKSGASGYILNDCKPHELVSAIQTIHYGGSFISKDISQRLGSSISSNLTRRESEILDLLVEGMSNKEIGSRLSLVEGTVKIHLTNILRKLQVFDRTQAVVKAIRLGLVSVN